MWGAGPAFLSDLTHESALPLSLRFLERQGGDFCCPTAENAPAFAKNAKGRATRRVESVVAEAADERVAEMTKGRTGPFN
jgi:hypothetical protein